MTYLGHSNNEAVSHIWDEAIDVNAQITVNKNNGGKKNRPNIMSSLSSTQVKYKFSSLHFNKVPIFQYDIAVALQRWVMAYTVVDWHTSWKSDTCERKRVWTKGRRVRDAGGEYWNATKYWPFFMSFSFLKIFPVSAIIKASPFSHRLSTETPAIAAPTIDFRASVEQKTGRNTVLFKFYMSVIKCIYSFRLQLTNIFHYRLLVWLDTA